ncbi:MAG: signal peptidase I [Terriglobales bacterium]
MAKKAITAEKEQTRRAEKRAKPEKKRETKPEFVASMAGVLVVGLFIITFCLQAFEIPSSSMEDTLLIGDHVFVDRVLEAPPTNWIRPVIPYRNVKRGDIVVFLSPSEPGLYVVKRIIGAPGDRLRLRNGVVYRNGGPLQEAYVLHNGTYQPYRDNFPEIPPSEASGVAPEWHVTMSSYIQNGELVVPPDRYFVMGDNRDVSLDSRYWGFVPRENIIGRPVFIYWSFETPPNQYMKTGILDRLGFVGRVIIHFFDRTRWGRMFRVVR